jgi:glycosyltransferase involved in cell wall biosynthesis
VFLVNETVYNIRTLFSPQSGVQRYAGELNSRFNRSIARLAPSGPAQGVIGHLWEQFILPLRCHGRLLFSPGNTGPLLYRQQVVTIHDASCFDQPEAFTGLFGRWYCWLLPKLARRALGVITVSEFSRNRLASTLGIPIEKIAVVYDGITQPPAALSAEILAGIKAKLNLPDKFLLFVGSNDPRKNLERLKAAFASPGLEDLNLVLAGGNNRLLFDSGLPAEISGRVRVLGRVDELVLEALYALAEGFVFPSLYEGFGLPPLEAMARGCPVLCSDASCLPEVCGPSYTQGGACLYFSPHETETIADALRKFASLPAATKSLMADAGRRQARKFSWDCCAVETMEALNRFKAGSCYHKQESTA